MKKVILLALVIGVISGFYLLGGRQYLTPNFYQELFQQAPVLTGGVFFAVYVLVTAMSLPGAAVMTLIGGAVFGFGWGLLLISFASTIGATLAFLITRLLLKDWVQAKFGQYLKTINEGVQKDGAFYLLTLRLIPAVPFFVINLVMGLTPMKAWRFYWVSQLGMLAGTAVYVNAGAELGKLDTLSVSGILSPALIGSFVLLAIFPWIVRSLMNRFKRARKLKGRKRPKQFTDNLIVIGAGAGGLVSSYIAAVTKAKVTLIEKHKMGGDCLNTGCVPSKALIHAARQAHDLKHNAPLIGVHAQGLEVNFSQVMSSIHQGIKTVEPHDSVERYTGLGVNCVQGSAQIIDPWTVEVTTESGKEIRTARNLIIAAGGRPRVLNVPGLDDVGYVTSDTMWEITEQPKHLLIIGAGPIGCELAQSFCRLGSSVTMVDPAPHVLGREDQDVVQTVQSRLEKEGVTLKLKSKPTAFRIEQGAKQVEITHESGQAEWLAIDQVLMAVGREANTQGYGLESIDLALDDRGFIDVDEYLETSMPGVYAVGDVIGGYQFTHVSAHEAWFASVNALFGHLKRFKADYAVVPWATYTDPEVGRVGLNEATATEQGIPYEVTRFELAELDRAIVDQATEGFVKVLTVPGKDKILGATIVGAIAGELISEFTLAMRHGLGLNKILGTIHPYPTMSEAAKYAAGEWKRNHAPQGLLNWVERYHAWRRG